MAIRIQIARLVIVVLLFLYVLYHDGQSPKRMNPANSQLAIRRGLSMNPFADSWGFQYGSPATRNNLVAAIVGDKLYAIGGRGEVGGPSGGGG